VDFELSEYQQAFRKALQNAVDDRLGASPTL
jgi:hypothetical protein